MFAIERNPRLAEAARDRLHRFGYHNVEVRAGDCTLGWPEEAPFDAILVSAGGPEVPRALLEQLAPGGRLVIPVGGPRQQRLLRITQPDGLTTYRVLKYAPGAFNAAQLRATAGGSVALPGN